MTNETQKPAAPRWMRIVLVVSLALNLGVAGVMGGAVLRWGGADGPPRVGQNAVPGDLSFRTAVSALPEADRRDMRENLRRQFRLSREAHRAGERGVPPAGAGGDAPGGIATAAPADGVIEALRAPEFDPRVITRALAAPMLRANALAEQGHSALVARIAAMPLDERRAYADRLMQAFADRADGTPGRPGPRD
ncbi:periplasmic heavy metal sensor [Roseicitreum antarcticum]|uniref:Heavy-metal resistance n=1 Tax=Roseicitreum antarcticum TaxID=564137 RepID=A0A1H3C3Q6_9RHOB|nr:periplasmic heavy metal sensor [Roseicitreum antarcticum]SDX48797.1 Heavy-metal resistance [Roseicitreum antarcticum]